MIYSKKEHSEKVDSAVFPGVLGAPQNSLLPGLAATFKYCQTREYRHYAERCVENAKALCDGLDYFGHRIVLGGTDTNIMVTDIKDSGVTAQTMLEIGNEVNIIFNGVKLPTCPTEGNKQYGIRLGTNVGKNDNVTIIIFCTNILCHVKN